MPTAARRVQLVVLRPLPAARRVVASAGLALAILGSAGLTARALELEYTNRVLPGVSLGDVPVGSLDVGALRARLRLDAAGRPPAAIEVALGERAWLASDASLGLEPDLDAAMRAALGYGKEGPLALRLAAWRDALVGSVHLPLPLRSTGDRLARFVDAVAYAAERPAVEGELVVGAEGLRATAPAAGRYVDRIALAAALRSAAAAGDRRIVLPVREVHPALEPARFEETLAVARAALTPLAVRAAGGSVEIGPATLGPLVALRRFPLAEREKRPVPDGAFAPEIRERIALGVDERRVAAAAAALAAGLDRRPRDATYAARANGSIAVIPGADGADVDRTALVAALRRAILDPGAPRVLEVATVPIPPDFGTEQAERDAPFLTRVGFAERYQAGEAAGAAPPAELVLPPGASVAAGALPARAAEALFAAALAAGYAADGAAPGWRNDTDHPIFARASVSVASLAWELWSVPPGREIVWSEPFGPVPGEVRRTVSEGGVPRSVTVVPARFGPLRETVPAAGTAPVTDSPAGR